MLTGRMGIPAIRPAGKQKLDADSKKRRCIWRLRTFLEPIAQMCLTGEVTLVTWGKNLGQAHFLIHYVITDKRLHGHTLGNGLRRTSHKLVLFAYLRQPPTYGSWKLAATADQRSPIANDYRDCTHDTQRLTIDRTIPHAPPLPVIMTGTVRTISLRS